MIKLYALDMDAIAPSMVTTEITIEKNENMILANIIIMDIMTMKIVTKELKNTSMVDSDPERDFIKAADIPPITSVAIIIANAINITRDSKRKSREKFLPASLKKEDTLNRYCVFTAELLNTPIIPLNEYKMSIDEKTMYKTTADTNRKIRPR